MSVCIYVWWDVAQFFETFRSRRVDAVVVYLAVVLFELIFRLFDFKIFRRSEKVKTKSGPKESNGTVKFDILGVEDAGNCEVFSPFCEIFAE